MNHPRRVWTYLESGVIIHCMEAIKPKQVFTVAEYIDLLNTFFKKQEARVAGEITELKRYPSGHVYFSIKDKSGEGILSCIIWGRNYDLCGIVLEAGMEVILSGRPNIYPQTGRFSFIADTVELVGEGALKKAYDDLKKKLENEGLFDVSKKRPIPEFVQKIGVITSREGAVIHDFLNNLGKFSFQVTLVNSRVEGQAALKDLRDAIRTMRKQDIEVLVIMRGGGSLESLQAFNNETLVREIASFPVPVIAGIGHDQDVPLLALAADRMVSTPTAVASLLSRPWEEAAAKVRQLSHVFARVAQEFRRMRLDLDTAWSSLIDHTETRIGYIKKQIAFFEKSVNLNDPARQLRLGYSLVRHGGKILRSVHAVKTGDRLDTQLSDGAIQSRVEIVE
jgi:exodeoxyribonuclease VII large subunit